MEDYSKYSYKRLLGFLQEKYQYDNDRTNYALTLLSMEETSTINDLLRIYSSVFKKLPEYIYMKGYVPEYWDRPDCWAGHKEWLALELNQCLNENLLRLYKTFDEPTKEQCASFVVNLRKCNNIETVQGEVLQGKNEEYITDLKNLIAKRDDSYKVRERMKDLGPEANGFKDLEPVYVQLMKELSDSGYEKSIAETRFESQNLIDLGSQENGSKNNLMLIFYIILVVIGLILISKYGLLIIAIYIGVVIILPSLIRSGKF